MGPQTARTQPTSAIMPRENSDPLLAVTTGQGGTPTMRPHLELYHSVIASVIVLSQRSAQSASVGVVALEPVRSAWLPSSLGCESAAYPLGVPTGKARRDCLARSGKRRRSV